MAEEILFEALTPLGFTVRVTKNYWLLISTVKHPVMAGKIDIVRDTLSNPDEIRKSKSDGDVLLFYKIFGEKRWICAVARRLDSEGFLITAYPADAIKEGEKIWSR
jgi:hypothetical protein